MPDRQKTKLLATTEAKAPDLHTLQLEDHWWWPRQLPVGRKATTWVQRVPEMRAARASGSSSLPMKLTWMRAASLSRVSSSMSLSGSPSSRSTYTRDCPTLSVLIPVLQCMQDSYICCRIFYLMTSRQQHLTRHIATSLERSTS